MTQKPQMTTDEKLKILDAYVAKHKPWERFVLRACLAAYAIFGLLVWPFKALVRIFKR